MVNRSVLLIGVLLGTGAVAFVPACSGPDPGAISFEERPPSGLASDTPGTGGTGGTGGTSGDGGTTGTGPKTDGGGTKDFFNNEAFAYADPGSKANAHTGTHVAPTNQIPLQGKNCVQAGCHLDTKPWAFAGTLYTDVNGTATVAQGEIRIVKADGTELTRAYTDADGNFWLESPDRPPAGSKVGVRKAGGTPKMMTGTIEGATGAACNAGGCHGSATLRVFAP